MKLIDPPGGRPWALLVLCAGSLFLNGIFIAGWALESNGPTTVSTDRADEPAAEMVAQLHSPAENSEPPTVKNPENILVKPGNVEIIRAEVEHSLARTFQTAAGERADVLAAVTARLFFWELDLRSDLQRGDRIEVAYTWDGALAHIPVATYTSKKQGKTLHAYQYQMAGDTFPSWWSVDGQEMAFRLVDGPLEQYEQITSLLKDRPRHRGMDFKVPEGASVMLPKPGTVVRTNWNFSNNGNCVEVKYSDGTLARFLHLSRTDVKPGQTLKLGSVLGLTGNTGHSTAPHLHYELEQAGKIIDPIDYHGVVRRTLPESERPAFEVERGRLDGWLSSGI